MIEFDLATPWHFLAFCLAVTMAGFVRGFAGFAGPATASLILSQIFAPAQLLPKIIVLDFYAYPLLVRNIQSTADWRTSLPMAVATIVMIPFGVHVMQVVEPATLKRMIGVACLAAIGISMSGFRFKRMPPWWMNVSAAMALGFVMSATFIALPIMTYFFLLPLRDAVCRATAISYSVTIIPFLGLWLGFRDIISLGDLPPVAMAGAVYFGMIYLGGKVFARVGAAHYRRVVQWVLVTLSASVLI